MVARSFSASSLMDTTEAPGWMMMTSKFMAALIPEIRQLLDVTLQEAGAAALHPKVVPALEVVIQARHATMLDADRLLRLPAHRVEVANIRGDFASMRVFAVDEAKSDGLLVDVLQAHQVGSFA